MKWRKTRSINNGFYKNLEKIIKEKQKLWHFNKANTTTFPNSIVYIFIVYLDWMVKIKVVML